MMEYKACKAVSIQQKILPLAALRIMPLAAFPSESLAPWFTQQDRKSISLVYIRFGLKINSKE